MSKRDDILNAWITIEQLSEGTIRKSATSLKAIYKEEEDWYSFFSGFLMKQKEQHRLSDQRFKKAGLIVYVDIFNFEEVVEIVRREYQVEKTYDEVSNGDKFTFALYFDNDLTFLEDKFFYTVSGYIRNHGKFPVDFSQFEGSIKEQISRGFSEDFNSTFSEILQQTNASKDTLRYTFSKDLDSGDVNLHSFFIEDLHYAKKSTSGNLERYFKGFSAERKNLDGHRDSEQFNPSLFESILQPRHFPLGRFPSNPDFSLSFMQQVAVNLALNDKNDIRSVNGPPGTGKTTLLKDIFADLVVQQAVEISELSSKTVKADLVYWKNARIGALPRSIADRNMIVASSNNGAVQNIVKELPKNAQIDDAFQKKLNDTDYFMEASNSRSDDISHKKEEIEKESIEDANWGTFSLEGGAATNIKNLLSHITKIVTHFKEYDSNPGVYEEFKSLCEVVMNEKEQAQRYYHDLKALKRLKHKYSEQSRYFEQEEIKKRSELNHQEIEAKQSILSWKQENENLYDERRDTSIKIENISALLDQAKRNFEVVKSQKPSILSVKKLFNTTGAKQYNKALQAANDELSILSKQKVNMVIQDREYEKSLQENESKIKKASGKVKELKADFHNWITTQQSNLKKVKDEVTVLEKQERNADFNDLDFSLPYEELQKSNSWFGKKFRIKQSELFISALKVRKQFLYENLKSLKAASNIWKRQDEYVGKDEGERILFESWQWINFAIPVISTTFASFGRMFKNLHENSIGNLFIDEAGQALPQASVGAIFRSKKVMVVGDPSQIKPVMTLDANVLNVIRKHYKVNEKFISSDSSTQTILDDASEYGFHKNDGEWIGIPLWVHRRSNDPMFTISNDISYDGLMVQGKSEEESKGESQWFDVDGKATDKFVKEQAALLKQLINQKLNGNPNLADDIYVISPFKNVATKLEKILDEIKFTKREKGKATNIGTVHTFQGKEAKIVYFVLGADSDSSGAARWAVSDPNIMNVAATRAKEEFYIIGDKKLYASLGCEVATKTISIIESYNGELVYNK